MVPASSEKTALLIPVGIFVYAVLFGGLYAIQKPLVADDVNIVGSTALGIGALVLGMGIVAGALMWSIVMLMTGLDAHMELTGRDNWTGIVIYTVIFGAYASLLSALSVWWLRVLGFGNLDPELFRPEVTTLGVGMLAVTIAALLLGWVGAKALVIRADVRATGLAGVLGLNQEVQN